MSTNWENDYGMDLTAQAEILELYKRKKTPDGRRDCIKQMAKAHGMKDKIIAEFLLEQGCQVDGRLVRNAKTRTVKPALGPEMPGWDGPEEVVVAEEVPEGPPVILAEPTYDPADSVPESELKGTPEEPEYCENAAEPDEPRMTAGVLVELLSKVKPEAFIRLDGEGYAGGLHVSVMYDATGEREEMEATILPQGW